MVVKVHQKVDSDYFKEFYSESVRFRSVWLKWQDKLGILSFVIAILIYFLSAKDWPISFGLMVFGSLMLTEFYFKKRKWMNERSKSNLNGNSFTMIFEEGQFQILGPTSETKGKWAAFESALETDKGLFLIPTKGISIYIQKLSFEKQSEIEWIVKKINRIG